MDDWFKKYQENVARTESSGDYKARNDLNYLGRYQVGAMVLQDMGYIKPGTSQEGLNDPKNWTGKGKIKNMNDYLNNPLVQEEVFKKLTDRNLAELKKKGLIDENTPMDIQLGYLKAAHLGGVGGAIRLARGDIRSDANGTSTEDYFNQGKGILGG